MANGVEWQVKTVGVSEVLEVMNALRKGIPIATVDGVRKAALVLERFVKEAITGGNPLKTITGELRASYSSRVFVTDWGVRGVVGSPLAYAAIHEYGGIIRPRRARALTIPLTPQAARRKARDYPNLFVFKPHEGVAFLAQPTPGGGLQLLYKLAQQVTIPARQYLTKAGQRGEPSVVALVGNQIALTVRRAEGTA